MTQMRSKNRISICRTNKHLLEIAVTPVQLIVPGALIEQHNTTQKLVRVLFSNGGAGGKSRIFVPKKNIRQMNNHVDNTIIALFIC